MAKTWYVTGEVNGGGHDGKRFVLQRGFRLRRDAEMFVFDYERKKDRAFRELKIEKEEP